MVLSSSPHSRSGFRPTGGSVWGFAGAVDPGDLEIPPGRGVEPERGFGLAVPHVEAAVGS